MVINIDKYVVFIRAYGIMRYYSNSSTNLKQVVPTTLFVYNLFDAIVSGVYVFQKICVEKSFLELYIPIQHPCGERLRDINIINKRRSYA